MSDERLVDVVIETELHMNGLVHVPGSVVRMSESDANWAVKAGIGKIQGGLVIVPPGFQQHD